MYVYYYMHNAFMTIYNTVVHVVHCIQAVYSSSHGSNARVHTTLYTVMRNSSPFCQLLQDSVPTQLVTSNRLTVRRSHATW
jgi:hypothetical protein